MTPEDSPSPDHQQRYIPDDALSAKSVRKELHWLEILNFSGQIVLAIVGIIAAYIYGRQLNVMKSQLNEMEAANLVSQQTAYESCRGSQISRAALIQSAEEGRDAHASSIASTYQTIATIQSEAAHIDLTVKGIQLAPSEKINVFMMVKNTGKSSATKVVVRARVAFIRRTEDVPFLYPAGESATLETPRLAAGEEPASLQPNGMVVPIRDGKRYYSATVADIDDFKIHNKDILIFAHATYLDSLGIHHWVNLCNTFPRMDLADLKEPSHKTCIYYNDEDHNSAVDRIPTFAPTPMNIPEIVCTAPKK